MPDSVNPKRAYNADRRQEHALRRNRAVVATARTFFLERGFAATTMADVAAAAEVSVQNVYKVFGNKVGLAKAVFDVSIAGDYEAVPLIERAALMKVRDEPDPRQKLKLYGEHLAASAPRHVPVQLIILDAAANDPDAATVWAKLQTERLQGMTIFAKHLAASGHLRADVSAADARDVLWTYNSAEIYRLLVINRQWPANRYGTWIANALIAALLPPGKA